MKWISVNKYWRVNTDTSDTHNKLYEIFERISYSVTPSVKDAADARKEYLEKITGVNKWEEQGKITDTLYKRCPELKRNGSVKPNEKEPYTKEWLKEFKGKHKEDELALITADLRYSHQEIERLQNLDPEVIALRKKIYDRAARDKENSFYYSKYNRPGMYIEVKKDGCEDIVRYVIGHMNTDASEAGCCSSELVEDNTFVLACCDLLAK
jgi:hypothetical protein